MKAKDTELRNTMSRHSDEELLMIVGVNRANFRKEAIDYAVEELTRRGIPFSSAGEIFPHSPLEPNNQLESRLNDLESELKDDSWADPELKGVGGWLLFLCISLTILNPLLEAATSLAYLSSINYTESYRIFLDLFYQSKIGFLIAVSIISFIVLFSLSLQCFSIYAGYALWAVKNNAVKIAKIYLVTVFIVVVISILLQILSTTASPSHPGNNTDRFFLLRNNFVYPIVWYLYLSFSTRVRATYIKK